MRLIALVLLLSSAVTAQPRRIVSTAPSITEILFALGLGDRVIGVTTYCHYPAETSKIQKVGTLMKPDMETILALRPDLVVVQNTKIQLAERFKRYNWNLLEVKLDTVADIYATIRSVGKAARVSGKAEALERSIRADLAKTRSVIAGKPKTTVMFVVGRNPGALDGMIGVGGGSYISEVMDIAGGLNIFNDSGVPYPKLLHEEILARDPQVIVDMGDMADTIGVTEAHKRSVENLWTRFPSLQAVKNRRVHAIASDIFVVPGPRVVDLAREFGKLLHPELFR